MSASSSIQLAGPKSGITVLAVLLLDVLPNTGCYPGWLFYLLCTRLRYPTGSRSVALMFPLQQGSSPLE